MAVESAPIPAAWRAGEKAEQAMYAAMREANLSGWEPQKFWCPGRRFKADAFFTRDGVIVEVVGAAHLAGRKKLEEDCERYAIAASMGYLVVTVTAKTIKSGKAIEWLASALRARRAT